MGISPISRAVRFFSCANNGFTRAAEPSPMKITPGLPITRCTASKCPVAATPGVTRHLPRMLSSAHAAAPVWPSALLYTDFCARLPKMMNATNAPSSTPSGISVTIVNVLPLNTPATTAAATISTNAPIMYGRSRLSSLRCIWNACHSWLRRCLDAAFRAAFASALAALLTAGLLDFAIGSGYGWGVLHPQTCCFCVQPTGPVGRSHQRTSKDTGEAKSLGELRVLDEFLGLDPPLHRVVAHRGPQVLRDGDDVAAGLVEIRQRDVHLVGRLAHAEDEVALGHQAVVARRGDHVEAALIAECRADPLEDPRHRLDVVRQHFRARLEYGLELFGDGVEVGDQQLDAGVRVECLDLPHRLGVEPRAAVGLIVAGHTGDRRVPQPHRLHALRDPPGLVAVQLGGLAGVDLAEVAPPGALLAADEEGGLAVLPALVDVGAAGLFADRVQAFTTHQSLELLVLRACLQGGLDPRWLAFDGHLGVADFEAQQLAASRFDTHGVNATSSRPSKAAPTASATASVTSLTPIGRPSSALSDVTPASVIPHGTIVENAPRSQSQFSAKPCSVVARATRMPIAPTLRAGRPSWPGTHTPDLPSTLPVDNPSDAHTAMSESSRRRTNFTTSNGSANPMIGYPTSWPGPCQVILPPRSVSITGTPSTGRSWGSVRLPAVYTDGCSRSSRVSGPPATRASASSRCSSHALE